MKKLFFGLATIILVSAAQLIPVHASIDDFTIRDFQADYYLDKDSDGRSTLKTIELITAEFPSYNQNHGIERAIPMSYDGHSTSLDVQSVTNQNDANLPYSTYKSNGNLVLRIGDADTYAHGINTYKITYTQRDVTRFFTNTDSDEFYWDTNGIGWSQDFDNVTARLHVASGLINSITDDMSCYQGITGSTDLCDIKKLDEVITASAYDLKPGQNMTISVGFRPQTFSAYKKTFVELLIVFLAIILNVFCPLAIIGIFVLVIIVIWLRFSKGKGAMGRGIIVAEYLPPKDVDLILSAVIDGRPSKWVAATYVDLAVRHNIRITEQKEGMFKKSVYSLQFLSSKGLTDTEISVLEILFGKNPSKGVEYKFDNKNPNYALSASLLNIFEKTERKAKNDGYYEDDKKLKSTMAKIGMAIVIASIIGFIGLVFQLAMISGVLLFIFGVFGSVAVVLIANSVKPLSIKGRELLDYLRGLELYIGVAEEERIKVLQSPQGAEKTPIDVNDSVLVVHLYERVLAYAVLFGNEKEWAKVLGKFYEQQAVKPDWYVGNDGFNMIAFSSSLSRFSSNATSSTYSFPSSSSSGGSGGGGFSGGGGGGGGGGGW